MFKCLGRGAALRPLDLTPAALSQRLRRWRIRPHCRFDGCAPHCLHLSVVANDLLYKCL